MDRLPSLNAPHKHAHVCACGDYYVCSRRDGCPSVWTCPSCEQEQLDQYVSQMAAEAAERMSDGNSR